MRNSCTRIINGFTTKSKCVCLWAIGCAWTILLQLPAIKRWRTCFLIQSIQCWVHPEERAKKCCHSWAGGCVGDKQVHKSWKKWNDTRWSGTQRWFLCTCVRLCFAKCLAREIRPFKFLSIVHLLQAPTLLRRTSCSIDCYVRRTSFQFFMRS